MRFCQPPDGNSSPKYKLLCFITTKKNCKEKNTLAFNRDRCYHLVLCLQLIPFHCGALNRCSGSAPHILGLQRLATDNNHTILRCVSDDGKKSFIEPAVTSSRTRSLTSCTCVSRRTSECSSLCRNTAMPSSPTCWSQCHITFMFGNHEEAE
jgi:hypothetical protein